MRILLPLSLLLLLTGIVLAQGGRDPWERLQRFDEDGDGKISRDEFRGPQRFFDRLDADGDGFVTKQEAFAMRRNRGGGGRGGMDPAGGGMSRTDRLVFHMDRDNDGKVTQEEWEAYFEEADKNGDGILQNEELRAALSGRELNDPAPKVGEAAPKVSAVSAADGRMVDLSRPKRTTVLVFGSWT